MKRIFTYLVLLVLLFSCTSKPLFVQVYQLPDATWNRFNSLRFEMLVEKPGDFDVSIVVKHDATYAYSNLSLDLSYFSSDGESRTRPHNLNLMNESGVFSGIQSKDGIYEFTYEAFNALNIQKSGTISFEIDNVMPVFDLKGIHEVGITVRKHKKSN